MSQSFIRFAILSVLIGFVLSTTNDACDAQSNTDCKTCLNVSGCAFCKSTKKCFPSPKPPDTGACSASDLQMLTCIANAETLLIVLCSVGGVVLIAIIIVICCLRRKCRQRSLSKLTKMQNVNERQLEDRRAAAEIRSTERNQKAEEIRMKYGLLKDKDATVEYRRMN